MNTLFLLIAMTVGQYECVPVWSYNAIPMTVVGPSIVTVREPVIYFNIGEIERSRFYDDVHYPKSGNYYRVPIINGYAPAITKGYFPDGSLYLVYDYKSRIPYESVMTIERRRQKDQEERERALQPATPAPQMSPLPLRPLVPVPRPVEPAPEPQPATPPLQVTPLPVKEPVVEPKTSAPSLSTEGPMRRPSEVGSPERIITPGYDRQE